MNEPQKPQIHLNVSSRPFNISTGHSSSSVSPDNSELKTFWPRTGKSWILYASQLHC